MTKYQYQLRGTWVWPAAYWVIRDGMMVGECWPAEPRARGRRWLARVFTDPTITGQGSTRDQAVDDVYQQTGGPDA